MQKIIKLLFYTVFFISLNLSASPIKFLKDNLGNIEPYYKELPLPKNLDKLFKAKDKKLFRDILTNYLKDNPEEITNYRVKFILGYHYYKGKQYGKAIKLFRNIVGRYNELNDYIFFYLGDSYQHKKKLIDAYQVYSLVSEDSIYAIEATKRKLNILFNLKQYIHIKNFFQKHIDHLEDYNLALLYVKTLIKLGDDDSAILQLKKMWAHSEGKNQTTIENYLIAFLKKGKKSSLISNFEHYNRCEYLLQKKEYKDILKKYKLSYDIRQNVNIDKDICFLKASVYSGKLNTTNYINRLHNLPFKLSKIQRYYLDYIIFLYEFNKKKYKEVIESGITILNRYKEFPNNENIYIKIIESYKKLRDKKSYYKYVTKYIKNIEFKKNRKEYLYKLWFNLYENKNNKEALKYLKIYKKIKFDDLRDEARAKYYIAKLNFRLKNREKALSQYFKIILEDPFNYYSYLTLLNLKKMKLTKKEIYTSIKLAKENITSVKKGKLNFNNNILKIYELITLRLKKLAVKELKFYQAKASSENSLLATAFFFKNLRLYRSSRSIKFKALKKIVFFPNKYSFILFWQAFYPLKYATPMYKYAKKYKVNSYFSWSILREESAYNRYAKSASNAYGLMQLLYPTAVETAARVGIKLKSYKELFIPKVNIMLGVKYLQVLLDMFKGNRFYAAASYNAGARNVKFWIRNFPANNIYDWAEKIPVEQTNRYIYKVIGAQHTFNVLYTYGYFRIGKVDLFKAIFSE